MEIKRLYQTNLDQLLPLFDAYRIFYRKSSDLEGAKNFLTERLEKHECIIFGAYDENALIGFALVYPLFSSVRLKPIFLLNDLFVSPAGRNKSVGRSLLYHVQNFASSLQYAGVLLETEKTNAIGNHLYPSAGFHKEDDSNFYFWENK